MNKKVVILIIILIVCVLANASVHANVIFDNGWYSVKKDTLADNCDLNNIWVNYEDGKEVSKYCRIIAAHRGWGDDPENSLESIKHVKENGYLGFETDIYFTKDNIPVLSHDETINRIARNKNFSKIKEKIYIKDVTFNELDNYIFVVSRRGKVLKKYANNKITKFEDALKYSKENNLFIAIELKDGTPLQIESVVKMVKEYQMNNRVRWLSFKPMLLKYVIDVDKEAELQLLCEADYHSDCEVNSIESYCGDEKERNYYNWLLNTGKNHVYMKGNKTSEEIGKATLIIQNLPENINKYPQENNRINLSILEDVVYADVAIKLEESIDNIP